MKKFFILAGSNSGFPTNSMLEVIRQEIRTLREKIIDDDEFSHLFTNIEIEKFTPKKEEEDIYFYKSSFREKARVEFSHYEYIELVLLFKNGKENPDKFKIIFFAKPHKRKNYFYFDLYLSSSFNQNIRSIDGYTDYVSVLDEKVLKMDYIPEQVWNFLEHILLNSAEGIEHLEFHK